MAARKKTTLVQCLSEIDDPRVGNGKRHDLVEVLVIAVCAIFAEVQGFEDMAEWAQVKEAWLRRFLRLENGIPSHDTFNRIFRILDPKHFEQAFRRWVSGVVRAFGGQVSVDGKSLRGSAVGAENPVHMVSAFATGLGIVLGQEKVADKSNEIVCHERNRRSAGGSGVSPEMRVGPSRPAYRSRLQTATSCGGKESSW
jgi:hypothetical protein